MSDASAHVLGRRAAFLPASAVRRLNDAIEALIALADELGPDCDLEPSLGSIEDLNGSLDQALWAWGGRADFEQDVGDDRQTDTDERGLPSMPDDEASLAATNDVNQLHAWRGLETAIDAEDEHDGREPGDYVRVRRRRRQVRTAAGQILERERADG